MSRSGRSFHWVAWGNASSPPDDRFAPHLARPPELGPSLRTRPARRACLPPLRHLPPDAAQMVATLPERRHRRTPLTQPTPAPDRAEQAHTGARRTGVATARHAQPGQQAPPERTRPHGRAARAGRTCPPRRSTSCSRARQWRRCTGPSKVARSSATAARTRATGCRSTR